MNLSELRFAFVKMIYADHNRSRSVRRALAKTLEHLGPGDVGLNVGAGTTRLHPQVLNLDIFPGEHIDLVGVAEAIPAEDNAFKVVVTQEVLEHVEHPFQAAKEIYRVLQPGGILYCQLPFIIGYHPGPTDFWRFTREGIASLLTQAGLEIEEQGIAVGNGTGFYRVLVEFMATLFSVFLPFLYPVLKALFAILFYPIKWLDFIFSYSEQCDRIPGGYYVIARKMDCNEDTARGGF